MSQNVETFGKYILLEKVAMGGMAEVYLSKNQGVGGIAKFVAMKRILPQFSESAEFIDMFKDEARIAVNLSHSNIVSIHEFGMERGQFFIVMDYVEGKNLRQILNKMKKTNVAFSIEQVLYVIKEVAAGLDHAHRCLDGTTGKPLNIIHRDMSPQNVMISFEGEVKIVDFGIAKAETQLETTRAGTLKGKFGYMSPEQAEGLAVDLRTDVFSLGIVLWELLANDRLFVANNEINTLRKIRDCQIPSLRKINPNIPPELERIVSKALAKDRNMRYQTAAALHREISRFLNRQYPDFSPHDFAVFIKTLFAGEILESRKKQIEYAKIEITPSAPAPTPAAGPSSSVNEKTMVTMTKSVTENTGAGSEPHFFGSDEDMKNDLRSEPEAPAGLQTAAPQSTSRRSPPPPRPVALQTEELPKTPTEPPTHSASTKKKNGADSELDFSNLKFEPQSQLTPPAGTTSSSIREGTITGTGYGTYYGTRSISRTNVATSHFASTASLLLFLVGLGTVLGAGFYYYSNPERALMQVTSQLEKLGLYKRPVPAEQAIEQAVDLASIASVRVPVISNPPGAEIFVDGKPYGEVTPATLELKLPKDGASSVRIRIQLQGYLPQERVLDLSKNPSMTTVLQPDKKGYLDINVVGNGQILVNGKVIAMGSPANGVEVPADQDIVVRAYDPATRAMDERVVRVSENKVQRITLIPRASKVPQEAPPHQKQ